MKYICLFLLLISTYTVKAVDSTKVILHFPFNEYKLTPQALSALNNVLSQFHTQQDSVLNIKIEGHTDQIGSLIYNQNLSSLRVNEVYKSLTSVLSSLVTKQIAFGKLKLITTDTTAIERQKNRRVEITFYFIVKTQPKPITVTTLIDTVKEQVISKPVYIPPKKIKEILSDTTIHIGDTVELPYLLFIAGLHDFLPVSYPHLDELFFAMRDNPNLEIEIQGHICCAEGIGDAIDFSTGKTNLSIARAKAVYDFLVISGIDKNRITYKGFGHQFPLTKERNEMEKARNRRVEIKILKK